MTIDVEPVHTLEFLLSEAAGQRSRENGTLVSGQNLAAGAVLGVITASGKYSAYNNAAADGTQTAAAILCGAIDATAGDADCAVIARDAEVDAAALGWIAGAVQADKDAATVDLATKNIHVR